MKSRIRLLATTLAVCGAMQNKLSADDGLGHSQAPQHFWPHARGAVPGQYGVTDLVVPHNLSAHLAWTWHHPKGKYHTTVAGGPVIDKDKNLYLTLGDGIWKLSPEGEELWNYPMPNGNINNMPALMDNAVFANTKNGWAFALDMDTGKELWNHRYGPDAGGDSGYPAAYDGLFVFGAHVGNGTVAGGNTHIVAVDAKQGNQVWEYELDTPTWNFMPLFPGDDTLVFMDFNGGVYRLGLHNGTKIWHSAVPNNEKSFSDGGVILGSNNIAYACSNPGTAKGSEGSPGVLRAFQVSDGKMLWEKFLPQACNSWPAVGRVGDSQDLSVVAAVGNFMGAKKIHGGIMVFDAATGAPQWQYQAPLFLTETGMAVGDMEGRAERGTICLPAHWSAPTITGDGAIYAGRSDGKMYRVKGPPTVKSSEFLQLQDSAAVATSIDFETSSGVEVETFDAHGSFLHGSTAFAPGMMAAATCNENLYVFKY